MTLWLDAAWGVVRRDAIIFMTYRTQAISQILSMVFQLTTFYFISRLLRAQGFGKPSDYFAFVVVGLAIMQVLISTLGLAPGQVRQELVAGTMERFIVSPFGPKGGIVAMMIFPILSALVFAVIMLALAALIFGLPIAATAPLAIPVALVGSFAFIPFAIAAVAAVLAFKQATAGTQFVVSGLAIVGGLYFPVSLLPGWLRWTSEVQPLAPAADLLRKLLVGTPLQHPWALDLIKLVGFGVVLFPLALALLRRAMLFGQRRGTIIEY
jgi:ABC-2 type transport system permease protein